MLEVYEKVVYIFHRDLVSLEHILIDTGKSPLTCRGVPLVVYTGDETRKFIEWLNSEGYSLASTYGGGARWVYVNIDTKAYIRGKQGIAFS